MIVTHRHLRTVPMLGHKPGYCNRGARLWFQRQGLSWGDFLRNGIDEALLLATRDPMARKLVEHARGTDGRQ